MARGRRFEVFLAAIAAEPYRYDFYQTLRRIAASHPQVPPLGEAARPIDEPVRVAQPAELDFAPAAIHAVVRREGSPPRLMQRIFGLLGPNGALPLHLTEYARERERHHGDPTFQRFLDTFTHRFALLFYRAWADAQPTVSLDRPENKAYFNRLGSLIGIGLSSLQDRDQLPDSSKIHFAGRLARQTRDAEGLLAWIRVEFDVAASVEQWCGHWMPLMRVERTRLGRSEGARMGRTAVLGASVWDVQHKFRITLGPLSLPQYQRFLPGGTDLARLQALVRHWLGVEFAWDVRLILKKEDVPRLELGSQPTGDDPAPWLTPVAEGFHVAELVEVGRATAGSGSRMRLLFRLVSGPQQGAQLVETAVDVSAMHGRVGGLLRALAADGLKAVDPAVPVSSTVGSGSVSLPAAGTSDAKPPQAAIAFDQTLVGLAPVGETVRVGSDEGHAGPADVPPVIESSGSPVSETMIPAAEGAYPAWVGVPSAGMTPATVSASTAEMLVGRRCRLAVRHEHKPDGTIRAVIGARAGLGHTTWLGRYLRARDADDLRMDVERPHAEA